MATTPDTSMPDDGSCRTQSGAKDAHVLFGRYTLKRILGRGGMGIVWLAHDDELNRFVAMKFLPDMIVRDREAVEDLKRETRRSLDLTHHHIVRIYDFTQDEMVAAIVMEYVDGATLSAIKSQQTGGCFGVSVLAPWISHFVSALDYAHRQARVIHRDLKPSNLMVNSRGDMKITDFGISRSLNDSLTRVSASNSAGTITYMSPEQALGAPPAPGDDIYAFGATVYDLLTGRPPFFRGNLDVQLETVTPPKMGDRRAELGNSGEPIPDLWEDVIAACLRKRPQDRPQSMAEVGALLGLRASTVQFRAPASIATGTGVTSTDTTRTRDRAEDATSDTGDLPAAPREPEQSMDRSTEGVLPETIGDGLPAGNPVKAPFPASAAEAGGPIARTIPLEELTNDGIGPVTATATLNAPAEIPAAVPESALPHLDAAKDEEEEMEINAAPASAPGSAPWPAEARVKNESNLIWFVILGVSLVLLGIGVAFLASGSFDTRSTPQPGSRTPMVRSTSAPTPQSPPPIRFVPTPTTGTGTVPPASVPGNPIDVLKAATQSAIEGYTKALGSDNPADVGQFLADTIDYEKLGSASRASVIRSVASDARKWPERTYTIETIQTIRARGANGAEAIYVAAYKFRNAKGTSDGRMEVAVQLDISNPEKAMLTSVKSRALDSRTNQKPDKKR